MESYPLEFRWLGEVPYEEGERLQQELSEEVRQSGRGIILGLEHSPVITLGIRGDSQDDLVSSEKERNDDGIQVIASKRGGQATLHSPGQLVIYPVLPTRAWKMGPKRLVCLLERSTSDLLQSFGVEVIPAKDEPGLFTPRGKIAFFGLRINKGVSSHGLALNVTNDLRLFRHIRSCGQLNQPLDSLLFQGVSDKIPDLFKSWCGYFERRLKGVESVCPA
ncbi:MAG: lipoyl(octanoyl) transferase LipB [Bdellovibrionaceae bacterium]|nr:lipoyl(octanoyl) transferase LipB [Bdellovibrionales bacterium]MCB9083644.1 lipoyl(octanoyl) transferase LipB [Pseudobdellovibrionaceae bacterium]